MRTVLMIALTALAAPALANGSDLRPTPGSGGEIPQTQAQQTANSQDQSEQKICKRIQATESRLGAKKVCLTAQQWKQREQDSESY